MAKMWKPLDLRRVRGQPMPGELIAVRQWQGKQPAYDVGRIKIINGRRSYYSVRRLGALMLSDESDFQGIEWMPMMEPAQKKYKGRCKNGNYSLQRHGQGHEVPRDAV